MSVCPPTTAEDRNMDRDPDLVFFDSIITIDDALPASEKPTRMKNPFFEDSQQQLSDVKAEISDVKAETADLKAETADLKAKQSAMGRETSAIDRIISDIKARQSAMDRSISDLKAEYHRMDHPRIIAFGAKLIAIFLDMNEETTWTDAGPSSSPSNPTPRYIRAAANFDKSKIRRTGLPDICFKLLKTYPEMIEYHNRDPHITERYFATLLMKDHNRKVRHFWEPYLEFCFKKTAETLAREERELIDSFYDGLL
ncbi:hypothetical protein MMC07_006794 [Pseudocyphellaria aurata]|nr:hypothetical protein [Pseudocyphellaria aurata]